MQIHYDSCNIFLVGSHEEHENMCIQNENGSSTIEELLQCSPEKTDDQVMFHLNHAVMVPKYHNVAIAFPDTDVFVCATHHFIQLMVFDLNELWLITGWRHSTTVVPIHDSVDHVSADVVDTLPHVHPTVLVTGFDTTSKIGTKLLL